MAGAIDMTQKNTIMILQNHWDSLREGNLPPFRSEISPREMPDVLDTLFILEHLAEGDTRVRIAGLQICEMMGMEVRGRAAEGFFTDADSAEFRDLRNAVMQGPDIAHLELEGRDTTGKAALLEMVLLPLRSDFGEVNRIIGCLSAPDTGFAAPLQFSILTAELTPVGRNRRRAPGFAGKGFAPFTPTLRSIDGDAGKGGTTPEGTRKTARLKVVV